MKRLTLILTAIAILAAGVTTYLVSAGDSHKNDHSKNTTASAALDGPLANATVSFGAWMTPLDRFPNVLPPPSANHHVMIPQVAKIKAGGSVNFIISGLHQVIVYADGMQPSDINQTLLIPGIPPSPPLPALPPLINDPNGRIYRGPDPRILLPTLDRVEVVQFDEPGTYLVICGVPSHFQAGMYGFVKVVP